jgi:hypothetical protein
LTVLQIFSMMLYGLAPFLEQRLVWWVNWFGLNACLENGIVAGFKVGDFDGR